MKKKLLIPLVLFAMLSCSKEHDKPTKTLNITLKSAPVEANASKSEEGNISIYPNPFHDFVYVNGANNTQIKISNENGDKTDFLMTSDLATLDFSKEKSGAYYFEILINKTVYRTYVIKY